MSEYYDELKRKKKLDGEEDNSFIPQDLGKAKKSGLTVDEIGSIHSRHKRMKIDA